MLLRRSAALTVFFLAISLFQSSLAQAWSESKARHEVQSLETGTASLEKRLELIENAERSIKIDAFIFACMDVGRAFLDAIIRRAEQIRREGKPFEVQILVDSFSWVGEPGLNKFVSAELRKHGVDIKYYNIATYLQPKRQNHRNHRKILIVDDTHAILGGRNTADDFFDVGGGHNFLDRDVYIQGPIVADIAKEYGVFWNHKLSEHPEVPVRPMPPFLDAIPKDQVIRRRKMEELYRKLLADYQGGLEYGRFCVNANADLVTKFRDVGRRELAKMPTFETHHVSYVTDTPGTSSGARQVFKRLDQLLTKTQRSIRLENLTYLPDPVLSAHVARVLAARGEVKLLTNSFHVRPDISLLALSWDYQKSIARIGAKVFGYSGKWVEGTELVDPSAEKRTWAIHTKSLILDEKVVWIGSYNLDFRSRDINVENALVVHDSSGFAREVMGNQDKRFANGYQLGPDGQYLEGPPMWDGYNPKQLRWIRLVQRLRWLLEGFY